MLVRCRPHGPPEDLEDDYVAFVEPHGYPDPDDAVVFCSYGGCGNPGVLYLTETERLAHENGDRQTFRLQRGGRCALRADGDAVAVDDAEDDGQSVLDGE
jgi:hypothetical protein